MRIIEITYYDITQIEKLKKRNVKNKTPILMKAVGYLLNENKNYYWLGYNLDESDGENTDILIIPKGCVIELRDLK